MNRKILFINTLYTPYEIGGAERAVRMMAEQHVAQGGEAVVVTLSPNGEARQDYVGDVKVYYVPLANIGFLHGPVALPKWKKLLWHLIDIYNPVMGRRVGKIIREENPDIVEANNLQGFSVAAWTAAKSAKVPLVQVLRDYYLACANSSMFRKGKNCEHRCLSCKGMCALKKSLSSSPDAVAAVSAETMRIFRDEGYFKGVPERKIVYSGINFEKLLVSQTTANDIEDVLTIGYIGRIDPLKGIETLLNALTGIDPQKIRAIIAGPSSPDYIMELKQRYNLPNVEYLGVVDPSSFYHRIHMLVVPSLWREPMGRIIPEALANGVPVAVSNLGGMPELVRDGKTGYIFDPQNPDTLRAVLQKRIDEGIPTEAQTVECRESSREFSIQKVYDRHQMVWNRISGQPR